MRHDIMSNKDDGGSSNHSSFVRLQQSPSVRANIHNISRLLNTGLPTETLDICIKLCEAGVHPQALADFIIQIRRELESLQKDE